MQGLLYGVKPERWTPPDDSNHLLVGLSKTPMRLEELEKPTPIRDDWAVAKTRLTGICGSDAKMVFMDFGDDFGDSALNGYFSFPTVFGHEVVADVVEVGPAVTTLEVGQRVLRLDGVVQHARLGAVEAREIFVVGDGPVLDVDGLEIGVVDVDVLLRAQQDAQAVAGQPLAAPRLEDAGVDFGAHGADAQLVGDAGRSRVVAGQAGGAGVR